jgi:hypothetical protein
MGVKFRGSATRQNFPGETLAPGPHSWLLTPDSWLLSSFLLLVSRTSPRIYHFRSSLSRGDAQTFICGQARGIMSR